MTELKLIHTPNPVLRKTSKVVINFDANLHEIVDNMIRVMRLEGAVGLAAPQLGVLERIIVIELSDSIERDGSRVEPIPLAILINPQITSIGDEKSEGWEGCLSIIGFRGLVNRWKNITYIANDIDGNIIHGFASGFEARIIQHEVDHLNGVLFTDLTDKIEVFYRENK